MVIWIAAEIKPRPGESREDLELRVDKLLCFGDIKDAFDAAGFDLGSIEVQNACRVCDEVASLDEDGLCEGCAEDTADAISSLGPEDEGEPSEAAK